MEDKSISITGIPSGDGECFCFDVTEEEYIRIKGEKYHADEVTYRKEMNDETEREIYSSDSPWRIYPNDIFGNVKEPIHVSVTIKEVK